MFGGAFCGRGVLAEADGASPRRFVVRSNGAPGPEGFRLDQIVVFEDGERRERRWTLRADGPAAYVGTLTEASGPVRVRIEGATARLTYPLAEVPLGRMTQHLTVQPDGSVTNTGTVRVAGVPVRRLTEAIVPLAGDSCGGF